MIGSHTFATVEIKFSFPFTVVKLRGLVTFDLLVFGWGRAYVAVNVAWWLFLFKFKWPDEGAVDFLNFAGTDAIVDMIKKLETENQNLKDVKTTNKKLEEDLASLKKKYESEKKKREDLDATNKDLSI